MFGRIYGGWLGAVVALVTLLGLCAIAFLALAYLPWMVAAVVVVAAVIVPLMLIRRWEDRHPHIETEDRYQT